MSRQEQIIGNEALQRTLEELRGVVYTRSEVDALLSDMAGQALTYEPQTRSVGGLLTYDAGTESVGGRSLTAQTVHIVE